jgi:hypothetical protein
MSGKLLLDLAMKLSADTAELRRNVEQGKQSLQTMEQRSQSMGATITKSFATITAAYYGVRGAINQFQDLLNSTMTGADQLRRVQDGLAGSLQQMYRSVSLGGFDGMITDMERAYQAAVKYSDALDELSKKQLAVSLDDVALAADIFRLDQIIYDDDQGGERIMAALKEKERLYVEHYAEVQRLAEENKAALYEKVQSDLGNVDDSLVQQGFEYVINYNQYDEAREAAQEYFDIMNQIASVENTRSQTRASSGSMMRNADDGTGTNAASQIQRYQARAEQVFSDLEGMARFIVENANIVEVITPINQDIIDAEKQILQTATTLEQNIAKITREERRLKRRFRVDAEIVPGEVTADETEFDQSIDTALDGINSDQFRQIQVDTAINLRDWENALLTLDTLQDKMKQLNTLRDGMAPDDEGYRMINEELSVLQSRIAEIKSGTDTGDQSDLLPVDNITTAAQEAQNSMMEMESITQSATASIVDAFFNMADGVDVSVGSIIKSILRMTIMQFISQGIGALFNPVAAGANMLQGVSPVGQQSSFLPQNFSVPGMADGGIFYGPQVVQVAEYSGAQYDPEIIGRASQIRQILGFGNQGNQQTDIALNAAISADFIHLSNSRSNRRRQIVE